MELSVEVLPAGRVSVQKYEKVGVVKHCEVGWIESVAVSSRKNWFGALTKEPPGRVAVSVGGSKALLPARSEKSTSTGLAPQLAAVNVLLAGAEALPRESVTVSDAVHVAPGRSTVNEGEAALLELSVAVLPFDPLSVQCEVRVVLPGEKQADEGEEPTVTTSP